MPIRFTCICGRRIVVPDEAACREARCSACKRVLGVPPPKDTSSHRTGAPEEAPSRIGPADPVEGLRAYQLSKYFNADTGADAARAGLTHVLNGYWLYVPYALLIGSGVILLRIVRAGTRQQAGEDRLLSALAIGSGLFLMAGFLGCIKDGVFDRSMGIARWFLNCATHFPRVLGTGVLIVPIVACLVFGGMLATEAIAAWNAALMTRALVGLLLIAAGAFLCELLLIPLVIAVLEQTNPFTAVGRAARFVLLHPASLVSMNVVLVLSCAFASGVTVILWWLLEVVCRVIMRPWLFKAIQIFVAGFAGAAVLALPVASLMVLYLSKLPEERLRRIHGRLRGYPSAGWQLWAAIACLAGAMAWLAYRHFPH